MQKTSARAWDWLSASLLFLIIQVAAARLVTADWTSYLYFAEILSAFGTALGLALGISRFRRGAVIWLVIGYSLIVLPWQMIKTMDQKLSILNQLISVSKILFVSLVQFIQRQPVKDSLFFVAFISFGFWLLGLSAGYWLTRRNNLMAAILPAGVVTLFIQIYDNYQTYSSWWLAIYLAFALLLIGRDYYRHNQVEWTRQRVSTNEEAWPNIFSGLFVTVAGIVFIAWIIPTSLSGWQSASDGWNQFTRPLRDRLSNAVSSLDSPYANGGTNFYGEALPLGRNAALGDSPIFTVKVISEPQTKSRYYWRGRVYDVYSNGQWINTPTARLDFQPGNSDLKIPNADNRAGATLLFTLQLARQSLLYAPSQPVWVDKPGTISATPVDTGINDVLSWEANPALETGTSYQVRAQVANPTVEQLRAAGTEYPDWVTKRYLAIPDAINPEMKALAEKIGIGNETPYDKASAITNYLRANIQYATSLPPAPEGRDPILWFLFEYKKGFCNYYASAEVLLLRSIGIPARLAVGFAQGTLQNDTYTVRKRDTHAWPEVYFPGIGWAEFEPTVSQDALARPAASQNNAGINPVPPQQKARGEGDETATANGITAAQPRPAQFAKTPLGIGLIFFAPILTAALMAFLIHRYRLIGRLTLYLSKSWENSGLTTPLWVENWRRWNHLTPLERAFANVNLSLRWLGKPQPLYATPAERAASLSKLMPSAAAHIEALTFEHESALFTPRPANLSRARRASFFILLHTIRALIQRIANVFTGEDYTR
ncbi:MAG: hypothetical protein HYX49_08220 [Chloroflexi bacterium]|nr:hypothetical protein [Chloroflexota bacterium]